MQEKRNEMCPHCLHVGRSKKEHIDLNGSFTSLLFSCRKCKRIISHVEYLDVVIEAEDDFLAWDEDDDEEEDDESKIRGRMKRENAKTKQKKSDKYV